MPAPLAGSDARADTPEACAARLDTHGLRKDNRLQLLEKLVAAFRQALFGGRSEKSNPDQLREIAGTDAALIAEEGLSRIDELYRIEADINGLSGGSRPAARQQSSTQLVTCIHQ